MAGLRDTLATLAQLRRRFDGLLKPAAQHPRAPFTPTGAGGPSEVADFGSNPGALRMLSYVPSSLARAPALVVALHGCTQTAHAYDYGSGWSELADRHGFALLLPEQQHANNPNTCFTWFHPADTQRDSGEALSIRQMIERMIRDYGVDRSRVYVVGLSAGGAMAAAMLAAYPEVFAAGAIIAGLPYGSAATLQGAFEAMAQGSDRSPQAWGEFVRSASPHHGPWPKLSVWHGSADHIVNPRNAEGIVSQWANVHGLSAAPDFVHQVRGHTRRVWCDATGAEVIEAYTISGMGHGVPLGLASGADRCGHAGAYHFDVGLSSSAHIARFWGIAADGVATAHADAEASGTRTREPDIPLLAGLPGVAAPAAATQSFERSAHADDARFDARGGPADPRDVVAAALQKVGLLVPAGSKPAGDPRSIISSTLRSVGLLKE